MCLGIPGQVVEIADRERRIGVVEISGVRREVNLACVVEDGEAVDACLGLWVLVHVGFAMSRIDPDEAQRTLDLLRELGDLAEQVAAMRGEGP